MSCRRVLALLSEYRDGMLDEETSRAVRAHLDGCPGCRREIELYDKLQAVLDRLKPRDNPRDYRVRRTSSSRGRGTGPA